MKTDPEATQSANRQAREDGLHITAMRAQRIYNDSKWPNPVVLTITNATPGS
jgi:alpha-L-fucosidase